MRTEENSRKRSWISQGVRIGKPVKGEPPSPIYGGGVGGGGHNVLQFSSAAQGCDRVTTLSERMSTLWQIVLQLWIPRRALSSLSFMRTRRPLPPRTSSISPKKGFITV